MKRASSAGASPRQRSRERAQRRSRWLRRAREIVWLVAIVLGGVALVAFLIVADSQFIARVSERSGSSTLPAVLAGAAGALGTVAGVVWYRRRLDRLGVGVRRLLGRAAIAWSVLFVVAFYWTHSRSRDAELAGPLHAGVMTYVLLIVVAAAAFAPIAVLRLGAPRRHRPDDRIRVWRLQDKKTPYLVAYCDCGWVSAAHDLDEPQAREHTFREARRHGTNLAPEVDDPLGDGPLAS